MTKEQLFEAMIGIDEERLEHSEKKGKSFSLWIYRGAAVAGIGVILLVAGRSFPQILQNSATSITGIFKEQNRLKDMISGNSFTGAGSSLEENSTLQNEQEFFKESMESVKVMEDGFWMNGAKYISIEYKEVKSYELAKKTNQSAAQDIWQEEDSEKTEKAQSSGKRDSSFEEEFLVEERDLGEIMGVIEECEDKELVGCIIYHYASYPDSDTICIVKRKDFYQFYMMEGSVLE